MPIFGYRFTKQKEQKVDPSIPDESTRPNRKLYVCEGCERTAKGTVNWEQWAIKPVTFEWEHSIPKAWSRTYVSEGVADVLLCKACSNRLEAAKARRRKKAIKVAMQ